MESQSNTRIIQNVIFRILFIFLVVIGFISFSETTDEKVEKLKTEIENLKKQLSTISVTENTNAGSERKTSMPGVVQVGHGAISYNENGIAIGEGSGVWPEGRNNATGIGGIAIGISAGSHLMTKASHEQIIAFNHKDDTNKMIGGIAIGYKTHARIGTIDLGNRDYVGEIGDIEYGKDSMTNVNVIDGIGSTTIGTNSINSGNFSSISGAYNTITNRPTKSGLFGLLSNISRATQGFGSSILGTFNSIENNFSSGFSKSGMASSIVGIANRVNKSNGVVVLGAGNEVTNSYLNANINPNSGYATIKELSDSLRKMSQEERLASIFVLGGGNKVNTSLFSNIQGVGNKLEGLEVEDNALNRNTLSSRDGIKTFNNISSFNYINGYENFGKNINYSNIIGVKNKVENADKTFLAGNNIVLKGTETEKASENIIIGFNKEFNEDNIKESVKRTISLGNENKIKADNTIILGSEIEAKVENSVYLGSKSTAILEKGKNLKVDGTEGETTTAGATGTVTGIIIDNKEIEKEFAGKTAVGAVSIGASGSERRLMNVAAGEISKTSTDAINGSQLYSILNNIPTDLVGDSNISVTPEKNKDDTIKEPPKYTVSLNGDLKKITSISNGDTEGTKITLGSDKNELNVNEAKISNVSEISGKGTTLTLGNNGLELNNKKITGVAAGEINENSTDAINGSQLFKYINNSMGESDKKYQKLINENTAGIAGALAQANIPQVAGLKRFGVGFGVGIYEKALAAALGISGQNKSRNLVYKASVSLNDKLKFGFGAGINYSFGDVIDESKLISEKKDTVYVPSMDDSEKKALMDKIGYLENKLAENDKMLNYLKDKIEKASEKITTERIVESEIKIEKIIVDEFITAKGELRQEQKEKLDKFFKDKKEIISINIVGYTDIRGGYKYNLNLGLDRAYSVYNYLISLGIDKSKISSVSSSGYNNVVKGYNNSDDVKENRRVEINILYK